MKDSEDIGSDYLHGYHPDTTTAYLNKLVGVTHNYKVVYPQCTNDHQVWHLSQWWNLQKYNPGQGYKIYHFENNGGVDLDRHLTFMTYLNDVPDGGTHWLHQDFYCPAIKGLTVIWPAQWMFTHKGVVSNTTTKYISTGWYVYEQEKNKLY